MFQVYSLHHKERSANADVVPYALTIFVGAFLLFQVQPLIAKYILPWFGGGPAVWTTAMLFFQVVLLGGYAYAHLSIRRFSPRVQAGVHLALLAAALTQLPITPAEAWKPTAADLPTWRILLLLTATIGLPYFVLSSTAPLLQAWFSQAHAGPGRSPYRLYALSNFGSLLALVSYPFVVEPLLSRTTQVLVWSVGFGLFVVACGACAVWTWRSQMSGRDQGKGGDRVPAPAGPPPAVGVRLLWLAMAACAVVLLLAVTNQISQDVTVIPFLWVLPLSLYLLTFIIAFGHKRWYVRPLFAVALVPAMIAGWWIIAARDYTSIHVQIAVYSAVLFVGCMICHGELSRLKPDPRYLTGYFLTVALGGALGGAFVAVVAPLLFHDFLELHLAFLGVSGLALVAFFVDKTWILYRGRPLWAWTPIMAACLLLVLALSREAKRSSQFAVLQSRNFYGVLSLLLDNRGTPDEKIWLRNGDIHHGLQYTAPDRRRWPTTYYGPSSGAGLALRHFPRSGGLRIGLVGLGVGTLATYGKEGDSIRAYEINPDVKDFAEGYFTYLKDSPADVEIVLGDARLSMEQEAPQRFDLLLLDAFSGDAVPVHLLTKEAFEIYRRHLEPDGVIGIHVSNRFIDLIPVVRGAADYLGLESVLIASDDGPLMVRAAKWMLVTANRDFLELKPISQAISSMPESGDRTILWTDDFTSLFQVFSPD